VIGFTFQLIDTSKQIAADLAKAAFRNIQRAAFAIYKDSAASIKDEPGPSKPGTPPHTHTTRTRRGKLRKGRLPKAIVYHADKHSMDAVIGPRFSVVGLAGEAHEKGEVFYGTDYPDRAFMGPALDRQAEAFGNSFRGSLGNG
jgi:hypothetical protein